MITQTGASWVCIAQIVCWRCTLCSSSVICQKPELRSIQNGSFRDFSNNILNCVCWMIITVDDIVQVMRVNTYMQCTIWLDNCNHTINPTSRGDDFLDYIKIFMWENLSWIFGCNLTGT